MKIAYLGPRDHFHTTLCRQLFLMRNCRPLLILQHVIKAYEQGLVDYSVVPVEILSRVVFMKPWTTFSSGSHSSSCRNRSAYSSAVDGGSRPY